MHKSSRHRRNTARGMERTRRLRLDLHACARGQQLPENGVAHAAWLYRPLKERGSVSAQRTHHAPIENGSRAQLAPDETLAERCRKAACVRHAYHTTAHQCRNGDAVSAALPPAAAERGRGKACFPPIERMRQNKREGEEHPHLIERTYFPSPLRALVSSSYSNKHHHHRPQQ